VVNCLVRRMVETGAPPKRGEQHAGERRSHRRMVVLAVACFLVVLWGGYIEHWAWTGINGHTATLWDWLHLLLLPVVVGFLPIWLSRRTRVTPRHKRAGAISLGVFSVLVLFGYVVPWAWTGFVGNTLWDWIGLIALPLALALVSVYEELRRGWTRRHSLVAGAALATFGVVILGGYLGGWKWTGFEGNTVWDWLHLLLLPLLIPAVAVPALKPMAMSGVTVVSGNHADPEQQEDAELAGVAVPADRPGEERQEA
jgi:hypothetical protein